MKNKTDKIQRFICKLLSLTLTAAVLLCAFPLAAYAQESEITVTQESDITDALAAAVSGDTLTFVFGADISLNSSLDGNDPIVIPSGVTAVFTNLTGADVTVTRAFNIWGIPFRPMVTVNGTLILQNNADGGSITLSGGGADFLDASMLTVNGSFVMNSGTITACAGYCGPAVNGLAGSSVTVNGGELSYNSATLKSVDKDNTGLGGAIYTAGSLSITGGAFRVNYAHNRGGAVYAMGDTTVSGGSFTDNIGKTGGGGFYYLGGSETLLTVSGGSFTGNSVSDGLYGGGIYVDEGYALIVGGTFANNAAPVIGGGIYVDEGAEVQMLYAAIYGNTATGYGGGIFNCATGGGDYQRFCGMTLYGNTAGAGGDDFFSDAKLDPESVEHRVYVSNFTMNGSEIGWYMDAYGLRYAQGDQPAAKSYYQDSSAEIALKSGASMEDMVASVGMAALQIYGNTAFSGAGIGNNGILHIGYSGLAIEKQVAGTGAPADDTFTFTVTFSDGNTYDGVASGGTVSLKAGEKRNITNIPQGVTVTVTENVTEHYLAEQSEQSVVMGEHDASLVFVNRYSAAAPETGSLTVSKTVTGNMGDRSRMFAFTVNVEADGQLTEGSVLTAVKTSADGTTSAVTVTVGSDAAFELKHGESVELSGLPLGTGYTVTEADYSGESYSTACVSTEGGTSAASVASRAATGVIASGGNQEAFTNSRETAVPTGITLEVWPYALIVLLAASAAVLLAAKKRRSSAG